MAFSLFLATIPLMGLFGMLVVHGLRGEPRVLTLVSTLFDLAPDEVRTILDRQFVQGSGQAAAPVFLLGSLWLAAGAFHTAMTVFEGSLGTEQRSWIRKQLIAVGCVVVFLAFVCAFGFLAVTLAGGVVALLTAVHAARLAALLPVLAIAGAWVLVAGFFRVSVRYGKGRIVVWPGATATVAIGALASFVFAVYARTLASYAVFYGSLAAVAVFLVWLWICCLALMVGVETNAHLVRMRRDRVPARPR